MSARGQKFQGTGTIQLYLSVLASIKRASPQYDLLCPCYNIWRSTTILKFLNIQLCNVQSGNIPEYFPQDTGNSSLSCSYYRGKIFLVYCLTTHYITDLNCLIHKYVTENNQIVFHKPNTYNSRKVCTNVYMFTDVLMEFLVFFASLFSKIASKFSLPTASNIAIVVVVCNTKV